MEALNSEIVFEEIHIASKEELMQSIEKNTLESAINLYDEPGYFFKGAVFGFIFCVPFWAIILFLICRW